uniref:DUF7768 domain-containing protein n=1 Tax=Lachnoclostridium phocaeense TaxID=1871021 RepID=UPI0026DAB9AE|nr:hypothetical protein [Lachnoclostridium phocaeense]
MITINGYELNDRSLADFARSLMGYITIPDDLEEGSSEEINTILKEVEYILDGFGEEGLKAAQKLLDIALPEVGYIWHYLALNGDELPTTKFVGSNRELLTCFRTLLLAYMEILYYEDQLYTPEASLEKTEASLGDTIYDLERLIMENPGQISYICSPLRGETLKETHHNMMAARWYMVRAWKETGYPAVAPHGYIPVVLDDAVQEERDAGLDAGKKLLYRCKRVLVCGDRISEGMEGEIKEAARLGIPIWTFSGKMFLQVAEAICKDPDLGARIEKYIHYEGLASPVEKILCNKVI